MSRLSIPNYSQRNCLIQRKAIERANILEAWLRQPTFSTSFGILAHNYLRIYNLVFVAHLSKQTKFKWLGEVEYIDFKKVLINFF